MSSTRSSAELMVGTRKGLFTLRRGPSGWDVERCRVFGDSVNMLLHVPARRSALCGVAARSLRRETASHDHRSRHVGGMRHTDLSEGATISPPPSPSGPDPSAPRRPANMKEFWALEIADPAKARFALGRDHPGRVVTVGRFRHHVATVRRTVGPFRTGQLVWRGKEAEPGIHSVCVDPRDPQRVAVAVS